MSKVYELVQKRIIADIEKAIEEGGSAPWIKPWNSRNKTPKNFISKKPYRGINLLLLPHGGYYITFKQLKELQKKHDFLKLKKGSKANMVVFWSFQERTEIKENNENEESKIADESSLKTRTVPIFRYYNVFHESDIEGFENLLSEEEREERKMYEHSESNYKKADELLLKYNDIVPISYIDVDSAYYSPATDKIVVPPKNCYEIQEHFYATCFHEIIHSTGHSSRLDRLASDFKFGDHNYSKEELVAEIGSAMLLAEFGINNEDVTKNSNTYLYSWLSAIKKDINLITYAAQYAQKACDYIIQETNIYNNDLSISEKIAS